jgi:hypothetical protein
MKASRCTLPRKAGSNPGFKVQSCKSCEAKDPRAVHVRILIRGPSGPWRFKSIHSPLLMTKSLARKSFHSGIARKTRVRKITFAFSTKDLEFPVLLGPALREFVYLNTQGETHETD